ncbi:MAG: DNA-binding transcriptional regulator Fis [Proteobacteria bacterium]|nr:MAG: DNA-binding transcriptional regulator Fis [Pseudomonadota bacterium]QKK10262.1 MAG: DNA-binding transcriptional regulator Fis [Pseudomonadota bacterium]
MNRKTTDTSKTETLRDCVHRSLDGYFAQMDGHPASDLYQLVMGEIEPPLLECVMRHCGGNQTRAASILGLSRSTLRKKLRAYGLETPTVP